MKMLCLPKRDAEVPAPSTLKRDLSWKRALQMWLLKVRSGCSGGAGGGGVAFTQTGHGAEAEVLPLWAKECKDWWPPQELGEVRKDSTWSLREHSPANTLPSDSWPPELSDNKFLLLWVTQFVALCHRHPGKQIEMPAKHPRSGIEDGV